jgi:uncharacterized protein YbaR (Trm112 family)
MDKKLLEILACPVCKGPLEWQEQQDRLTCARCKVAYPIEEGIPNLLPDSGRPID